MKKITLSVAMALVLFILSCEDGSQTTGGNPSNEITTITGFAQKGPFVIGTKVSIVELDNGLLPTGRTFTGQINSNDGEFQIDIPPLSSQYVEVMVDGYYFNEVTGQVSDSSLILYAISDISVPGSLNVNLLTTIERERVRFLMSEGYTYGEAKRKAQEEILSPFEITLADYVQSEYLSINGDTHANGAILALTLVLTGYRSNAAITTLLFDILQDLEEDGVLNDTNIQTDLINHSRHINSRLIRNNMISYYEEIDESLTIPNFEGYLDHFNSTSSFSYSGAPLIYPPEASFGNAVGPNILSSEVTTLLVDETCLFDVEVPEGATFQVKISANSNDGIWYYSDKTDNVLVNIFDNTTREQWFTCREAGKMTIRMFFGAAGEYTIEYYEMLDEITRTKTITVQ